MSAYDAAFESAWYKWGQAMVHAQALRADIDAVNEDGSADAVRAFRAHYYAKRHGFGLVVEDVSPIPVRWRLRLGDIASNYRASLDHLAWALVCRGRTPPGSGKLTAKQESAVYFPICDERTVFNAEIRVPPTAKSRLKLPGVRRADAAKVRRRQPYLLPPKRRPKHALALLSTINNDDKHRAIQPVWAHATRIDIEITDTQDCLIPGAEFRRHPAQPLKTGAELAFVPARKTGPDPQINVKMDVMAEPGIADAISAAEWVSRCGVVLWQLLREFSTQPPEITELGATLIEL